MSKVVLITGCSSGIGLIAAQDLHNRGYRVLAACRKPQDVENMHQLGLEGIELDLDDSASVERAAAQVITLTGGKLYALFNNGGFGMYGALSSISRRQMEQQFATNLFGTHQLTQLLLPAMLPHGEGRIIQTSSVMGLVSGVGRGAYAASKFALEAWSDALRMELHSSGIQVSLIEPGPISTHFTQNTNQAQSDQPVHNSRIVKRLRLPPQTILPKLHHALESPRAKLRYPVTLLAHTLSVLRRILPSRCMDWLLRNIS
ncbi:SDR family oxidoreductase [Serratia symbiotica]|uniref:SDR family oxidoreductase n=1 Tax=Serratia symbiotica TaxID=138074 RepID=UPI001DB796B1|nr:SDR family oxidoreductase [Serratia symbiotica]NIG88151.1 SDR family oxidoreductase [Serratia symbiotica]USS95859.1 SDR family oxidoreductase [Serratia symbiotica]